MAVDVETKYLFNEFPYLGKDESRLDDASVPTSVAMKLMGALFVRGYNFTGSVVTPCAREMQCSCDG